jgi:GTP cyclohydrolase II
VPAVDPTVGSRSARYGIPLLSDLRDVARAIDALRRGWPVAIDGLGLLAVETADDGALAALDRPRPADILISGNRAATLKLANQREGTPTAPVLIERAPWVGLAEAVAIADPAFDLAHPFKGPFRTLHLPHEASAVAALRLTRLAGLLPALFVGQAGDPAVKLASGEVETFGQGAARIVSRARLPNVHDQESEIVAFRVDGDPAEHVALLLGAPNGQPPLVRVHSECLTGDAFGSLKCDCGPQLAAALDRIAAAGWGILIYLRQEGRGIGLINKLRAYALQDQGFDTVDANHRLGFDDDERDFTVAAGMFAALGQSEVRLLTNNPRKVAALEELGIRVAECVSLHTGANPHNQAYLDTKRDRSGHQL